MKRFSSGCNGRLLERNKRSNSPMVFVSRSFLCTVDALLRPELDVAGPLDVPVAGMCSVTSAECGVNIDSSKSSL